STDIPLDGSNSTTKGSNPSASINSQSFSNTPDLPYNNNEYIPWRRNIEDILESAFGFSSSEYKRVTYVHVKMKGTRAALQRAYVRLVH
ncbi:unnamed protein product, partial [marine sediment metagenome]